MKTKKLSEKATKLSNKLSSVACRLSEDEFLQCDIVVSSEHVRLENWKCHLITTAGLRHVLALCDQFDLLPYVDFDNSRLTIHG